MFGFLKNLLRRSGNDSDDAQAYEAADQPVYQQPAPQRVARKTVIVSQNRNGHSNHGSAAPNNSEHRKCIEVPLRTILPGLPLEVQPLMQAGDFFDAVVPVPLERVLAQLSRGTVRISFGDIRAAVPEAFAENAAHDKVMVVLPLGELLSRLNPALIQRRRAQKTIEVPADISSPFDPQSQGLIFSVGPAKAAPQPASPARHNAPLPSSGPARKSLVSSPTPPPPAALPPPYLGGARPFSLTPEPEVPLATPVPEPVAPAPTPVPMPQPAARAALVPAPLQFPPQPEPVEPLIVGLTMLAESWPDAIRREIVEFRMVDFSVALPIESIEQALRLGRIPFSWKTLRSWTLPATVSASAHDSVVLELPLKIVAPLFLARQKEANKDQQRVAIDAEIPNLFFGSPQNELQDDLAVSKPADTNYYVWDDVGDKAKVDPSEAKRGPSPGTKFVAKYATPNEIVSRAASLEGVAGAIITLPDGLMVANSVPPDLNPDTVAAFLPQIFGKVSQCTKELRMGELNNLNFTVGNVPWKIFRVNAIFFAAFGREEQPLPTARLAALAAELDHKPR